MSEYRKIPLVPLWIMARNWPWQTLSPEGRWKWGMLSDWGRFGGGWHWKLGILWGGNSCILELVFGYIRITWRDPKRLRL